MSKTRSIFIYCLAFVTIPVTSSACYSSWSNTPKDQAIYAIDRVLEENGLSPSNVKQTLSLEYRETVEKITKLLEKFLKQANKIVYKVNLKEYVKTLINEKLEFNGISPSRIPSSLIYEYNSKCLKILKEIKDKMWFNNTDYISREEIRSIVDLEIDSYFIQRVKNESNNATTWGAFDAVGEAWANIFGQNTIDTTTSKPEHIYFNAPYTCSVCNREYQTDERIGVLSCGHCFHSSCAKTWLSNQKTCPLCQASVFLAKIFDSKEKVPGYSSAYTAPSYPTTPTYPTAPEYPTPSAPEYESPASQLPEHIYYDSKCSICLEEYKHDERVGVLDCGHTFHSSCIKEWHKNSKTCPMCRKENSILVKIYDDKDLVPR